MASTRRVAKFLKYRSGFRTRYSRGPGKIARRMSIRKNAAASRGAMATIWRRRRQTEFELESNCESRRFGATTGKSRISEPFRSSSMTRAGSAHKRLRFRNKGFGNSPRNPIQSTRNIRAMGGRDNTDANLGDPLYGA